MVSPWLFQGIFNQVNMLESQSCAVASGDKSLMRADRIEELTRLFYKKASLIRYFGMEISFSDEGNAVIELAYNPNLDNLSGAIHGGVFATLMDIAGGFTAALAHEEPCSVATTDMSVHYLAPARQTSLRAVGRLLKSGRRQKVAEMYLYDAKGKLVAHGTGTFIVRPAISLE